MGQKIHKPKSNENYDRFFFFFFFFFFLYLHVHILISERSSLLMGGGGCMPTKPVQTKPYRPWNSRLCYLCAFNMIIHVEADQFYVKLSKSSNLCIEKASGCIFVIVF